MTAGTCEAKTGPHHAGTHGCPEPATVTLRAACRCGHVREKRLCARHGQPQPAGGVWLCLPCAEAGHDCPLRPEIVQ